MRKTTRWPYRVKGKTLGMIERETDTESELRSLFGDYWFTVIYPDGTRREAGNSQKYAEELLREQGDQHHV